MKGQPAKGMKRVYLTVSEEPYKRLQSLVRALGWKKNWLSREVDKVVQGLLIVAEQAIKDAEEQREMTELEAKKRYEDLMRSILER